LESILDTLLHVGLEVWLVTARMALWLLLGFLVAGILSVAVSPAWLERHLGGRGMGPVFKSSLFGVPLPLCSCGVIPVAASLRRHGASKAATTAFLLSTPQTGVDSILVTWSMLGPLFGVFRPVAALLTGFLGGGLVQLVDPPQAANGLEGEAAAAVDRPQGLGPKTRAALDYGLVTLPGDIARALVVGVVVAGVLSALIPEDFLADYLGGGPLAIGLMMLVGIPVYVCATASVPLAASFIFLGATPGAALAFLVAGPATNAATIATVGRVLGRRALAAYLGTVAVSAWGGGMLLDWLAPRAGDAIPLFSGGGHHHGGVGWFEHLGAVVLVFVLTRSWWLSRRRDCGCGETCTTEAATARDDGVERLEFTVTGMNCSHCEDSVRRALSELAGVTSADVSLAEGRAVVTGHGLDPELIRAAIDALGFAGRLRA